eukprot:Gb_29559 [translate_table: standard]
MASADVAADTIAEEPVANEDAKATEDKPVVAPKGKKTKLPTEKKPRAAKGSKPPPAHPSYIQMITEAITALKERGGSSPQAIAKHIIEKYKSELPSTFKKKLNVQLRNLTNSGTLIKIKGSYKFSEKSSKAVPDPSKPKAGPGRPRKGVSAIMPVKPKGKRGRPPKSPGKAPKVAKPKVARKVGRPPKARKAEEPAPPDGAPAPAPKPEKSTGRSSGRPKKMPGVAKKPTDKPTTPSRSSTRAVKVVAPKAIKKTPKKVGRPPKKAM